MMRLPVAYIMLLFALLAIVEPIFWAVVFFFGVMFVHLSLKFLFYLLRCRGFAFVLKGVLVNYADALVSGIGVTGGLLSFVLLGRRY